ncbi:MAG: ACP S-malonyltransferase [Saprospiraceae bacterium]|nr:MAG: malonyl CoA-acyl carrier protein transacylase [Bacteroidetes bacterium OLB9]MCO6463038.1 ACP S-malonyltransferase [Saprospiraceae bacterium]MCZ2337134.1 ACP S-malonyltransferase [Chitinophagales bacterium]
MKAFVFPGQGAQFEGMGHELYERNEAARAIFDKADAVLGYELSKIMFYGTAEELKQTNVTQPALFVHSIATLKAKQTEQPDAVAGHSLGEFSALVANGTLSFEDGLKLVYARAMAMQDACDAVPGTMAAILGLDDEVVEQICAGIDEVVVAANYNCPGQLVISGSIEGVQKAMEQLTQAGARRTLLLEVGGAFHSPLMEPARVSLAEAIMNTPFSKPEIPVYQNVTGLPERDPDKIKENLIAQLTGAVKWTQTIEQMLKNGITHYVEVGGNGKVLSGLIKKVDRGTETSAL